MYKIQRRCVPSNSVNVKASVKMADEAGTFRSAEQSRVQLYIPFETAHDTTKALGEVGLFQPEDLSECRHGSRKAPGEVQS